MNSTCSVCARMGLYGKEVCTHLRCACLLLGCSVARVRYTRGMPYEHMCGVFVCLFGCVCVCVLSCLSCVWSVSVQCAHVFACTRAMGGLVFILQL